MPRNYQNDLREQLEKAYPRATPRTRDIAAQWAAEKSQTGMLLRSPAFQAHSAKMLLKYPGLLDRPEVAQGARTAAEVWFRTLSMVANPERNREVCKLMGLPREMPREEWLPALAQELGYANARTMDRDLLQPAVQAEQADRAASALYTRDLEQETSSGVKDAIPPISERTRQEAIDEAQRRYQIEHFAREARAKERTVDFVRREAVRPQSALQVDILRAMGRAEGWDPADAVDRTSKGVREWMKEREPDEMAQDLAMDQYTREANQADAAASTHTFRDSPDEAWSEAAETLTGEGN